MLTEYSLRIRTRVMIAVALVLLSSFTVHGQPVVVRPGGPGNIVSNVPPVEDSENSTPAQWWMITGQTLNDAGALATQYNARLVDVKYDAFSPYPLTATMVQNTGSYARQWWWYAAIDGTTLGNNIKANNARLVSFKANDFGNGQIRYTVAMVSNTGPAAKAWWYYTGLAANDINPLLTTNTARLTALQSYVSKGQTYYTVIMIANKGNDQKDWWWYVNQSPSSVANLLATNKARAVDLTYAGNGNFNVVMESCANGCPAWWWYWGKTAQQVTDQAQQNNARVLTADSYPGCGYDYCFAVTMIGGSQGTIHASWPDRVRGFVDLHTHPVSHLGFGGKLLYGGIDVGSELPADPDCNHNVAAASVQQALGHDNSTHGGVNILNNQCGDYIRAQVIHVLQKGINGAADEPDDSSGYPDFPNWPVWNDVTHQKMWVDWIKRDYDNGMRVMVALAVNNKTLGDLVAGPGDYATDDLSATDKQIGELKSFILRHSDFMGLAQSSTDVFNLIKANKMAIVIGVEVDIIGNLNSLGRPVQPADVTAAIQHLYGESVRYIFPVHLLDNAFGGTAVYDDQFNWSNRREAGHWWNLACATDPSIQHRFDPTAFSNFEAQAGIFAKLGASAASELASPPSYPQCNQVNAQSLTDLGATALQEMMKLGMMIDIDHMSDKTATAAIQVAQSVPSGGYPLSSGHNTPRGGAGSTERNLSPAQYRSIGSMHGMAGVGSGNTDAYGWINAYMSVIQAMGGPAGGPIADIAAAGFGTDTDGLALGMPPRQGSSVQYTNSFPASNLGTKTWNYNTDGVAHYGMLPDFLLDARTAPNGADLIDNNLMWGAQYFVDAWHKAELQASQMK